MNFKKVLKRFQLQWEFTFFFLLEALTFSLSANDRLAFYIAPNASSDESELSCPPVTFSLQQNTLKLRKNKFYLFFYFDQTANVFILLLNIFTLFAKCLLKSVKFQILKFIF